MLWIKAFGRNRGWRTLVEAATDCYAKKLMSHKILEDMDIEVHFVKNLQKDNGTRGQVEPESTKSFIVFLDADMSKKMTLMVLAHEMVHVQQFATGRLYQYKGNRWETVRWNNKVVKFDQDSLDYWFAPWEVEARGYEEALYYFYIGRKQND